MAEQLDNLTITAGESKTAGRKFTTREFEDVVAREAFKNKIQKSEKINLKIKSIDELNALLAKQLGIKNNKTLINRLPDKGARVIALCTEIEEETSTRTVKSDISEMLENLKIVEKRPSAQLLKKREAEMVNKPAPEKFHAHRNALYEKKCIETAIVSVRFAKNFC